MTIEDIAEKLGRSCLAVKLFVHRSQLTYRPSVKTNLVLELFAHKFGNPQFFRVTTEFLKAVKINQVRFWQLYRGEANPTDDECKRLAAQLEIPLSDAFETRQLNLFDEIKR